MSENLAACLLHPLPASVGASVARADGTLGGGLGDRPYRGAMCLTRTTPEQLGLRVDVARPTTPGTRRRCSWRTEVERDWPAGSSFASYRVAAYRRSASASCAYSLATRAA